MGWGSSTGRFGGQEVRSLPRFSWGSKGGRWDVPGILPGCARPLGVSKIFGKKKKKCVHVFSPNG